MPVPVFSVELYDNAPFNERIDAKRPDLALTLV